jgi:hypothetical protein
MAQSVLLCTLIKADGVSGTRSDDLRLRRFVLTSRQDFSKD